MSGERVKAGNRIMRRPMGLGDGRPAELAGLDYGELWSLSPIVSLLLDGSGMVLDVNDAACTALGHRRDFIIGTPLRTWVDAPSRTVILEHFRRCRTTTDLVQSTISLRQLDGGSLPVRLCTRRLSFRAKMIYPSIAIDITDEVSSERARIAAERQRDLAEQERAIAHAADAAKDRLIATVSHELRNPLSPALMAASSLESQPDLPAHMRRFVGIIKRNIQLEARLIDDLLDVARATRGQLSLRLQNIDIHSVLREAIVSCAPAAQAKGVVIVERFGASQSCVRADATRVQQVFWNLLNNAIKFSSRDGQVTVQSTNRSGHVAVSIRDFGVGIDADTLPKLFSPFEQPRASVGNPAGLGLGLTITRNIVQLHGGHVWASSAGPGRGSTFEVDLPVLLDAVAESDTPSQLAPRGNGRQGRRTLIVEDHEDSASVMALVLRQRGCDVTVVSTLADGLEALKEPWDIVLSDIGLGDGSGLGIGRAARASVPSPRHLIAVSGYGTITDVRASREAGFDEHLVKPIDPVRLLQLIDDDGAQQSA